VVLDGDTTSGKSTIGLLGAMNGTALVKTSGAITAGALVAQSTDGTVVTDPGTGGRVIVGVALQTAVSGDLIEVALRTPQNLS
jgi:hypothetical protein